PLKDCEKLFEPFSRGPGKQNVPGYGLGLSLVGRIAALHDAEISIGDHGSSSISVHFPRPVKT
ncbi:MAG: ATP-binding protein, partial [Pseudomonadota bacterium]